MISHILAILILHFVADFLLQTRKMGLNKGKSIMWLSIHVGVYLIALLTFGLIFGGYVIEGSDMTPIFEYCLLNAVLHWITDFTTSRVGGHCYLKMVKHKAIKEDYQQHLGIASHSSKTIEELHIKRDYAEKREYMWQYHFWSVIGFDQLLHATALILTYNYFFL